MILSNLLWFVIRLPVYCYRSAYHTGADWNSDCCCLHATQEACRRVSMPDLSCWQFAFEFWSRFCVRLTYFTWFEIINIFMFFLPCYNAIIHSVSWAITPIFCDNKLIVLVVFYPVAWVSCINHITRWLDSLPCLRECPHQIFGCSTGFFSVYLALILPLSHIHQTHSLTKESLPSRPTLVIDSFTQPIHVLIMLCLCWQAVLIFYFPRHYIGYISM